jgi:hypothetical protein
MSIAAHVAAWKEWLGGWYVPAYSASTQYPTHPVVELFIDEQWVDITSYVYYDDRIRITRGRSSESGSMEPARCSFTLNNRDGRFSPRNPTGVYYGQIGRNTPVRVSVVRNGVRRYRFYGEISEWPIVWDISGTDVRVQVEASGITRRLGQGSSPLKSSLYRELSSPARENIVAYWPMEDETGSDSFASGIDAHPAMTFTGTPTLSTSEAWQGTAPLPQMQSAVATAVVPSYTATGETAFRFFMLVPSGGVSAEDTVFTLYTTGTARKWLVRINTSGNLKVMAYDSSGSELLGESFVAFQNNGDSASMLFEMTQNGSDIDWRLRKEDYTGIKLTTEGIPTTNWTGTLSGYTVGIVSKIKIGDGGSLGDTVIGHVTLADDLAAYSGTDNAALGQRGERANTRFLRLCREEGIAGFLVDKGTGTTGSQQMGQQDREDLLTLINEVPETDLGMLYEPRDALGISYRTRISLYNQDAVLTLDYAQHELSDPPIPVDDDRYTRNQVTVTRNHGSSWTEELTTGAMSVQDPPDGVGRYDVNDTISLAEDDKLPDQAGWRLHLGTVDEARYPQISVNLRYSTFTSSVDMMNAALVTDIGDRIVIQNPPSWIPPDDISQLVIGYTETLGFVEHDITFACTPESPYRISEVEHATYARVDTDGSTLGAQIDSDDTAIDVVTQEGSAHWTTEYAEFPFDVRMGGEVMTVTEINYIIDDRFDRTQTSGWGTSSSGHAWTNTGGSATDYYVEGV